MGTSVCLCMIVRHLAQKARRTRAGVVGLGGFRYSSLSGTGSLEYENPRGAVGGGGCGSVGFGNIRIRVFEIESIYYCI